MSKTLAVLSFMMVTVLLSARGARAQQEGASPKASLQPILFEFNRFDAITNQEALRNDAEWLKSHPDAHVRLDGYADVRGEIVYNLALAQRRAEWTREQLLKLGAPESTLLSDTGWGKLYPVCNDQDESCWQRNRAVSFCAPGSCPMPADGSLSSASVPRDRANGQ
jgi:outer membrane protein OmpA-like peptidoglycan-associated protein